MIEWLLGNVVSMFGQCLGKKLVEKIWQMDFTHKISFGLGGGGWVKMSLVFYH